MNKILVVVDMQNDFIDGVLGTPEAQAIVPKVVEKIRNWDDYVVVTYDFHTDDYYLTSQEGQRLPIKHCIADTYGMELNAEIEKAFGEKEESNSYFKMGFGSMELAAELGDITHNTLTIDAGLNIDEIHLCGLCTDICVLANAITIKTFCPEVRIVVDASCCAGTTPEAHKIALKAMRQCQIDIENWEAK